MDFIFSIQGLVKVIKEFKYSHGAGRLSSRKCDKIKDLGPEMKNRQPWMEKMKSTLSLANPQESQIPANSDFWTEVLSFKTCTKGFWHGGFEEKRKGSYSKLHVGPLAF